MNPILRAALLGGGAATLPLYYQVGAAYWSRYKSAYLDGLAGKTALSTATRSAMGASLSGSTKWFGGVLGPDGKIYGIPFDATDILIIDPTTGTATRSAMSATLTGSGKWIGGVLGPDGKIYGIPRDATDILIIGNGTAGALQALLSGWVNKF